jgi:hypothetical protein
MLTDTTGRAQAYFPGICPAWRALPRATARRNPVEDAAETDGIVCAAPQGRPDSLDLGRRLATMFSA